MRLEVRDHGPGLPTSDAEALFERFWRSEARARARRGGAGLGLAIVAAIVDAHGGEVRAGNAPDGGAASSSRCPPRAPERRLPGGSQPPPTVVPRRAPTLWP